MQIVVTFFTQQCAFLHNTSMEVILASYYIPIQMLSFCHIWLFKWFGDIFVHFLVKIQLCSPRLKIYIFVKCFKCWGGNFLDLYCCPALSYWIFKARVKVGLEVRVGMQLQIQFVGANRILNHRPACRGLMHMMSLYHVEVDVLVFPFNCDIKNHLHHLHCFAHIQNIVFVYSPFSNSSYELFCAQVQT